MKKSLIIAIVGFVAFVCLSASAEAGLLVYEPFDYPDGLLNGQGGALGTTGTWTTYDSGFAEGWWVHPEGEVTGQGDDTHATDPCALNLFDGTVDNLPTTGGFVGSAGPVEQGGVWGTRDPTGNMDANIGLDPSVTATFQSGTTTWFSYVGCHADNRNQGSPTFMICTDPTVDGTRGLTMQNSGNGIGGVGGPPRYNLFDVYPHYFSGGIHHQTPGGYLGGAFGGHDGIVTAFCSSATCDGVLDESGQPRTQTMAWAVRDADGYMGVPNIVVGKIEWDGDTGGEDIISVVSFLEPNELSEGAFNALVDAVPALCSANWASNKPDLDQSQFDTINISSLKFWVDEIRIGTTFADVTGTEADPNLPDVDAGPNIITWSGKTVELDPNVVNNDTTPLTYLWTADDPIVVFDPSADIEEPNVTIIPPATVTTSISIVNAGFETPAKDEGIYSNDFTDCPGWSAFDNAFGGVWDISATNYGGVAPEGENIAYVYNGTAGIEQQVLGKTVAADTTYTLTVEVGNNVLPIAPWTGYTVQLLAGETVIGADDNSLTIATTA